MAQLYRGMSHGLTAEVWAGFRKRIRDVAISFDLACDGVYHAQSINDFAC